MNYNNKIFGILHKNSESWHKKLLRKSKNYFPYFSVSLLSLLVVLFFWTTYNDKPKFITSVITMDIKNIVDSLNKIDKECNILSIENECNYVDFLNVEKFSGSEVGCLNLAFPKNWAGPYLSLNPTLQGKLYEIIKRKDGNYVLPGRGVKLPNNLIVGKDFDYYSADLASIDKMLADGGQLNYKGTPLGAKLTFEVGDWGREELRSKTTYDINQMLLEFNKAIPFTYNQTTTQAKI